MIIEILLLKKTILKFRLTHEKPGITDLILFICSKVRIWQANLFILHTSLGFFLIFKELLHYPGTVSRNFSLVFCFNIRNNQHTPSFWKSQKRSFAVLKIFEDIGDSRLTTGANGVNGENCYSSRKFFKFNLDSIWNLYNKISIF